MATEVELSGMTINLVPDKATYDGMVKNPNEMYLVQDDYDLVVEANHAQGTSWAEGTLISGSVQSIVDKIEANPKYTPKMLFTLTAYYGTTLVKVTKSVDISVMYNADGRIFANGCTYWLYNFTCQAVVFENGTVEVYGGFSSN